MNRSIRPITPGDTADCIAIYYDAIHSGTAPHYTPAQREAWAPCAEMHDKPAWTARICVAIGYFASVDEEPAGFIVLEETGYLDLFFVRPDFRKAGIASLLYTTAIDAAAAQGLTRLSTHASHLARRFLERQGWQVRKREVVERNGVQLERFDMTLDLPGP